MTTPNVEPEVKEPSTPVSDGAKEEKEDERKRRLLLLILLLLLLLCCCIGFLFIRYLAKPQPLPQLLPAAVPVSYPPTYKFMMTGVDKPVGVAVSPDNQRIYVAESSGQRFVKMFDRSGNLIKSFAPPGTDPSNREPKYIAVDSAGRVFLVERVSDAIDIFDQDGNFLDAIIAQDMTLTKYLNQKIPGGLPAGTVITHYEGINRILSYKMPGQAEQKIQVPTPAAQWGPLGIRFDKQGDLIYSDITGDHNNVSIIPASALAGSGALTSFDPQITSFGASGSGNGQFNFPQTVVKDSLGNFYISDGNNTRIVEWTPDLQYKTFFGVGSTDQSINLPRGTWMDSQNHLHVVDAVGSVVRVFDVSGTAPVFLFNFGEYGVTEGQFNYPIDICIDGTGRLYIADRENNRIQVWSY